MDEGNVNKIKQTVTKEGVGCFLPVLSLGHVGEGRDESNVAKVQTQGSTKIDTVTKLETVFQHQMNEFPHKNGPNCQKKEHHLDQTWDKFRLSRHRRGHILAM
jgi:hypothetical protein